MIKSIEYIFKTDINSNYQIFWITHDLSKICPQIDLNFILYQNQFYIISIKNSNLTYNQIQLIFIENQIEFEVVSEIQIL